MIDTVAPFDGMADEAGEAIESEAVLIQQPSRAPAMVGPTFRQVNLHHRFRGLLSLLKQVPRREAGRGGRGRAMCGRATVTGEVGQEPSDAWLVPATRRVQGPRRRRTSRRRTISKPSLALAGRHEDSTAAQCFFGQKPDDLFDWLLARLDVPAQPRASSTQVLTTQGRRVSLCPTIRRWPTRAIDTTPSGEDLERAVERIEAG